MKVFHVKHSCKVFIYTCVTLKKYEFNLTFKKAVKGIYLDKEKYGVYFTEKMDEVRARDRIEVEIHQEKVDFINDAYEKELRYWKRAALESVSTKNEAKELIELAPARVIWVQKVKNEKIVNIDEIIFYLKFQYLAHNAQERTFIPNILSKESMPSFEAITSYLKTFSKSIKEDENTGLKNKTLTGGWVLIASKVYRCQNLSCQFEDWLYD